MTLLLIPNSDDIRTDFPSLVSCESSVELIEISIKTCGAYYHRQFSCLVSHVARYFDLGQSIEKIVCCHEESLSK